MSSSEASSSAITLEWFGATTYRLRAFGLTIFLDTWLDRPSNLPVHLPLKDVHECDYIFISHAHFDHLPGADVIAKRTGAKIVANGEAINVMRQAGVPEEQLIPVAGGEQIPLGDSGIMLKPYPALHCLMTFKPDHSDMPDHMDTGEVYLGNHEASVRDITKLMTKGFGWMRAGPESALHDKKELIAMHHYLKDPANKYSFFDGGQMLYHFIFPNARSLVFSSHGGCWEGIVRSIEPKPDLAILGIAGRANLDGKAFQGSMAEFITRKIEWLGQPKTIIWCLHDEAPLMPWYIDAKYVLGDSFTTFNLEIAGRAATERVESRTRSRILEMKHAQKYDILH